MNEAGGSAIVKSVFDRIVRARHELGWVLVGQTLSFLGGFAGIKLLTNAMGSEGYGRLALGVTIAGLVNMFVYGPIGQVVSRYFSVYRERGNLDVYFFVLKKAHVVVGTLMIVFTAFVGALVGWLFDMDWAMLVVVALLFGIVGGVNSSFLALQGAIRQRRIVATHQAADAWARPLLAVFGLWVLGNSAPSAFVGFVAGTLLITVSQAIFASRSPQIAEHWHVMRANAVQWRPASREYFSYAASMMIFAGFAAVGMYSDRWVIQGLFGEREVGIYAAIYQIANAPVAFLAGLISQFVVPIIFDRAGTMTTTTQEERSSRLVRQVVIVFTVFLVPIVAVAYFFGEQVIRILTNATFSGHSELLWVVVVGMALFNASQLLTIKGLNYSRPEVYLWPKAIHACAFVATAYFLAKPFQLMGVGVAMCVSSLLYYFSIVIVNKRLKYQITSAGQR